MSELSELKRRCGVRPMLHFAKSVADCALYGGRPHLSHLVVIKVLAFDCEFQADLCCVFSMFANIRIFSQGVGVFKGIRRKYIESKYRRNDWRIIEGISAQDFAALVTQYRDNGWELTDSYRSYDPALPHWQGTLRKGSSSLKCEWRTTQLGRVTGNARVMQGVSKTLGVPVLSFPSFV